MYSPIYYSFLPSNSSLIYPIIFVSLILAERAMIESIKEELGEVPEEAIGDRGYNNPDLIEAIEKKESAEGEGIKIYTSQEKTIRDKEEIVFKYDDQKDEYECSEGKR
jgi:hypothetical protein